MIIIEKAGSGDPWLETRGRWRSAKKCGGEKSAAISCPECGRVASLSNHKIDDKGEVSPSLICPYDACTFHEHVSLKDWNIDD